MYTQFFNPQCTVVSVMCTVLKLHSSEFSVYNILCIAYWVQFKDNVYGVMCVHKLAQKPHDLNIQYQIQTYPLPPFWILYLVFWFLFNLYSLNKTLLHQPNYKLALIQELAEDYWF